MASSDIYVQVTATADASGQTRSIVVLVPWQNIDEYKSTLSIRKPDDTMIAQDLADRLAMNVFTHRASFGSFKVARLFSLDPPPGIEGKPPDFTQSGLKAWLL
jgi:hypothetical protein